MQTAPCSHCGTPNATNLVACYYCGRRLAWAQQEIPDDLPEYQLSGNCESDNGITRIVGGLIGSVLFPMPFLAIIVTFGIGLTMLVSWIGLVFALAIIVSVGPLLVIIGFYLGDFHGHQVWRKFKAWCEEMKAHCRKVRAGHT